MKKICLMLLGLILALTSCKKALEEELTVTYFNVGCADAILLQWGDYNAVIDTGEASTSDTLLSSLEEYGVDTLDFLLISHFDQDHVGGAAALINAYTIDNVYVTFMSKTSTEIYEYETALATKNMEATVVEEETTITLGDATFVIYPPGSTTYDNSLSNNSSLCVHLTYGENTFLFPGDAEKERIKEIKKLGITAEVLKYPHHGRIEDNSRSFIASINPTYAIITSSEEDLEDEEVLTLLENAGVTTYLTREGTVTVTSNGIQLSVTQE
jgi:beta-lactamase superfamily II metal-dependent hydrolase